MPRKTDTANTEIDTADAPGIMPPEGVEAQVETKVKYTRRIDPDQQERYDGGARAELEALAASEAESLEPADPLSEFIDRWYNYGGHNCVIIRLPDPAARRMPGNTYARPCFELERLGDTPFDPVNFVPSLQMLNGYSGGVFRVFLTDASGQLIPGARLDRFAIADPPNGSAGNSRQLSSTPYGVNRYETPAPPASQPRPQQSPLEKQLADLQVRLLERALDNALNPATPAPPAIASNPLTPEQQLAMAVFTNSDLLGNVITKIGAAVNAPEAAAAATWKDKAMDFAMQNPAIATQLGGILERTIAAVTNVLGNIGGGQPQAPMQPPPPVQHAPQATPGAQAQAAAAANLPTEAPDDSEDEDDEDMAILEDVIALLNGTEPLTATEPTLLRLQAEYPARFKIFIALVASQSLETIYGFVKAQNPLYESLLTSPVTGEHLRNRIAELQTLCVEAVKPKAAPAPPPAPLEPGQ